MISQPLAQKVSDLHAVASIIVHRGLGVVRHLRGVGFGEAVKGWFWPKAAYHLVSATMAATDP